MPSGPTAPDRRSEPFAVAFRHATDKRGLSLERLAYHLRSRGHDLSPATLSYWRTGRSVPQRHASIAALGALEEILGVERGSLAARVPPRVSHANAPDTSVDLAAIEDGEVVQQHLPALGLDWLNGFEVLSLHDVITVGADRVASSHRTRTLLRAREDGADRYPVWYNDEDPHAYPYISAEHNMRVGRVREDPGAGLVVAEMLLPRPLRAGEVIATEHSQGAAGRSTPSVDWRRTCVTPMRETYLEVEFHPDAMPVQAQELTEIAGVARRQPLALSSTTISRAHQDFGPGIWGFEWRW